MFTTIPIVISYLLTPWRRILLEKLTDFQLVKKYPAFHGTRRFITAFTSASVWWFRTVIRFYGEQLTEPSPIPKLEDHTLSAVRDCLCNIFAVTLHTGDRSSSRNVRTRHAVVTGNRLSRDCYYYGNNVVSHTENFFFNANSIRMVGMDAKTLLPWV